MWLHTFSHHPALQLSCSRGRHIQGNAIKLQSAALQGITGDHKQSTLSFESFWRQQHGSTDPSCLYQWFRLLVWRCGTYFGPISTDWTSLQCHSPPEDCRLTMVISLWPQLDVPIIWWLHQKQRGSNRFWLRSTIHGVHTGNLCGSKHPWPPWGGLIPQLTTCGFFKSMFLQDLNGTILCRAIE